MASRGRGDGTLSTPPPPRLVIPYGSARNVAHCKGGVYGWVLSPSRVRPVRGFLKNHPHSIGKSGQMKQRAKRILNPEAVNRVHEMRRRGVRYEDIAKETGMSVGSVANAVRTAPRPVAGLRGKGASTSTPKPAAATTPVEPLPSVLRELIDAQDETDGTPEANAKAALDVLRAEFPTFGALVAKGPVHRVLLGDLCSHEIDLKCSHEASGLCSHAIADLEGTSLEHSFLNLFLAMASPEGLAAIAWEASLRTATGREEGESKAAHEKFLEGLPREQATRAAKLLRDAAAHVAKEQEKRR